MDEGENKGRRRNASERQGTSEIESDVAASLQPGRNGKIHLFLNDAQRQPFADHLQSLQIALGLKIRTIFQTLLKLSPLQLVQFVIDEIHAGVVCRNLHFHALQNSTNPLVNL